MYRPEFLTALLQKRCTALPVLPFSMGKQEAFAFRVVSPAAFTSTKIVIRNLPKGKALGKNLRLDSP